MLPGSLPRCHGERGEWNNAHVTAAIRSFFSFRSKGLIGAVRSAVGTNNGGRAERAARGQREEAEEWIAQPPPLPTRSPPPACWINFGMDAPAVAREALRSQTSCIETKKKKERKEMASRNIRMLRMLFYTLMHLRTFAEIIIICLNFM